MIKNKSKKTNISLDSNIIKQKVLRALNKIMFGEISALYKSLESTVSSLLEGCINNNIELYEENISNKIQNLLAWYEIELSHSLLKNFHHERERKTKIEYPPSLKLKEEEIPF